MKGEETGIIFVEDEDTCEIFTHLKEWQRKLENAGCKPISDDKKGKVYVGVPRAWIELKVSKKIDWKRRRIKK